MCFDISFRACEVVEDLAKTGPSHEQIVAEACRKLSQELSWVPETTIRKAVEWAIL